MIVVARLNHGSVFMEKKKCVYMDKKKEERWLPAKQVDYIILSFIFLYKTTGYILWETVIDPLYSILMILIVVVVVFLWNIRALSVGEIFGQNVKGVVIKVGYKMFLN